MHTNANIERLLAASISQRSAVADVREGIVVAGGCTDGAEAMVRSVAERDIAEALRA